MENHTALLMYSNDANIFYAGKFLAPDPFIFIKAQGKSMLVMSDLEIGRAKKEARVDEVLSTSAFEKKLREGGITQPTVIDIICDILRSREVKDVIVPPDFAVETADKIRQKGFSLRSERAPFYDSRMVKSDDEVKMIVGTQQKIEDAVHLAVDTIKRSEIRGDRLYDGDIMLTSEYLKTVMNKRLLELNCATGYVIASCGDQSCDPHCDGSGPILPNQTIILDVFPYSNETRYFADMTRTVIKGKASPELKRMYEAVFKAQERGISLIKDSIDGKAVHAEVEKVFTDMGYKTEERNGTKVGFIHGTGHGLGLEVHEPPRVAKSGSLLKTGYVVTVEPGLYYPGVGGIRLEDMILVQENGCRNLTTFPKFFEVD